jgi:tetrahydromethanopterin S-methyltransferase subunit C
LGIGYFAAGTLVAIIIGAVVGALVGYLIGHNLDKMASKR